MKLSPFHPLQIALGLIVWSAWFVALYAGVAVACERMAQPLQAGPYSINLGLAVFTLLVALLPGGFALICWRAASRAGARPGRERFIARLGAAIHLTAMSAMLFIALPLLQLPPCL